MSCSNEFYKKLRKRWLLFLLHAIAMTVLARYRGEQKLQETAQKVAYLAIQDSDEWTIHEIRGAAPISELMAAVREENQLHRNVVEDPENSYSNYWANGTKVTHTEFKPGSCDKGLACGVCNHYHHHHHDMEAQQYETAQKVASISSDDDDYYNEDPRFQSYAPRFQRMSGYLGQRD